MKLRDDTIFGIIMATILLAVCFISYYHNKYYDQQIELVQEMDTGLIQSMQEMNDRYMENLAIIVDTKIAAPYALTATKVLGPGKLIPSEVQSCLK